MSALHHASVTPSAPWAEEQLETPRRRIAPVVWSLTAHTHGLIDYIAVVWLAVTPRIIGYGDTSTGVSLGVALAIMILAVTTNYPLGLLRVVPMGIHLLADYALSALLILAPRTFGLSPQDPGGPMLRAAGLALLVMTVMTHAGISVGTPRRRRTPILA